MVARVLSVILIVLGIGLIVRTIAGGVGGGLGLFLGALLIVAGVLRLVPFDQNWLGSSRAPAGHRDALAGRGRLRRDRRVALLRARHRRARRARPDAVGAARGRIAVRPRLALVRGGNRRAARDRRRRDLRPARVQRPARVPDRLGDLPRLRDRDRARGALRAALPRQRGRLGRAHDEPDRSLRRSRRDLRDGRGSVRAPAEPVPARHRHRRDHVRRAPAPDRARHAAPLLRRQPEQGHRPRDGALVVRDRVRDPRRDARLHGARDRREPGRGDARAGTHAPAEPLRRHRRRGRRFVPDRPGRALCVSRRSGDPARHPLAARPARGRRRRVHGALARRSRRRPARVHRADRRRDPHRRDHDFVLGRGTPRLLARPVRHAPARVRAPQPQDADRAGDDHLDGCDLGRDPPDREGRERPGALPREPVQLRRPDRVHRRAGGRRAAPLHRAGSRAAVPRAGQRARSAAPRCPSRR